MQKKRRRLKKRNCCLILISLALIICVLLEISYTKWILAKTYLINPSKDVVKCVDNHHLLLNDCLLSLETNDLVKENDNVRYIGNNPNNYIDIGQKYPYTIYRGISKTDELDIKDFKEMSSCLNENRKCSIIYQENDPVLWQIIGTFKINDNYYTKLILKDSLGTYSWDESNENNNMGTNNWATSTLKNFLNNDYLKNDANLYGKSLENVLKYIAKNPWYLGTIDENELETPNYNNYIQNEQSEFKISCETGTYCQDMVERNMQIDDYVGLLSASDIAFLNENNSNWLTIDRSKFWLINPVSSLQSKAYALTYQENVGLKATFVSNKYAIYPAIYLKKDVKIIGGEGTVDNPYLIR